MNNTIFVIPLFSSYIRSLVYPFTKPYLSKSTIPSLYSLNNFCTLSSSFEFLGKFILILFAIGFKLETILSGTIKVKKLFVIPVLSNAVAKNL